MEGGERDGGGGGEAHQPSTLAFYSRNERSNGLAHGMVPAPSRCCYTNVTVLVNERGRGTQSPVPVTVRQVGEEETNHITEGLNKHHSYSTP